MRAIGFADAIERAELLIAETPRTWPQWPGARTGVRRYLIPGLLYSIAFGRDAAPGIMARGLLREPAEEAAATG